VDFLSTGINQSIKEVGVHFPSVHSEMQQKKYSLLILILTLCFTGSAFAQTVPLYSIKGNVRILIGLEILAPVEPAYIQVSPNSSVTIADSLGEFEIDSLVAGIYDIKLDMFGYPTLDTTLEITENVEDFLFLIFAECDINGEIAQRDISEQKPRLLIIGGIAPVWYESDPEFQEKYGVTYFDYGCVSPGSECASQYNNVIFKYLDQKYGKSWRKEVRKDVVGFKKRR
jgi:hypothetical protein